MTAPQVYLDIDLSPQPGSGFAYYAPTVQVTDPTDGITITTAAQTVTFNGTLQSPQLYATDNSNMSPSGWAWNLSFSQNPLVAGNPAAVTALVPAGPIAYTATNASPCVVTPTYSAAFTAAFPNGLPNGTGVQFTSGAPAGFSNNTTYYVVSQTPTTLDLAATRGGSAINSTGTGSGNLQVTRYTYSGLVAQSVTGVPTPFLVGGDNLKSIVSPATARTNLGLGTLAVMNASQVLAAQNAVTLSVGTVYNAAVNDLAIANCLTGNTTVNLPAAPANGSVITVILAQQNTPTGSTAAYTTTVNPQGGDVILGSAVLGTLYQAATWQYNSGTWYPKANTLPNVSVPVAQTFPLANNTYQTVHNWTVTNQTDDPLKPFGLVAGSQTYSNATETTQGPAFWWGYNPDLLSARVPSSTHGAIGISCFADAGDTWNPATGGHGLEFSMGCFRSPNGASATNALQVVACDDNTNTLTLSLRCGSGSFTNYAGGLYGSIISLSDASGNGYLTAGPFNNSAYGAIAANTQPGVQINQPLSLGNLPYLYGTSAGKMTALFTSAGSVGNGAATWSFYSNNDSLTTTWQGGTSVSHIVYAAGGTAAASLTSATNTATSSVTAQGTGSAALFQVVSASGTAQIVLNGNAAVNGQVAFQKNGVNDWVIQDSGGSSLYLTNNSGNPHFLLLSGANSAGNYNNATTYILTKTLVYGSLIVNNGGSALATTATQGFLYIPTCAGTPTGVPGANTGTVPIVYDTTNNQLNVYRSGAWHAIGI